MFVEVPAPAAAAPDPATDPATATAEPSRVASAHRPPLRRLVRATVPYLYLAPALAMLVVWTYRPLAETANYSFYSWNLLPTSPATPVGLGNYERLLRLPELSASVGRTVIMIVGLLPFTIVVPVVVGLLTREVRGRARTIYQALIFAPFLVAPIASAAVWRWLLSPRSGVVNRATGTSVNWFNERVPALVAITGITGWHLLGFAVLVVAAALATINTDYADAAAVDGASRWQITRWLTLPLLSPTLVFLLLMTVLLSAQQTFPLIDALTQGGPVDATTNVYYLLWEYGFKSFDAGLATAAGVLFFVAFGLVAAGLVRLSDRLAVHDD